MKFLKVEKLYHFLTKLYKIYIVVLIIAVAAGVFEFLSHQNLPEGYNPDVDLLPAEYLSTIIILLGAVIGILTSVNFLRILYRISKNMQFQHEVSLQSTPGWLVGYFFIPILSLYKPYVHIKEMWAKIESPRIINMNLLKLWWGFCVVSAVLGQALFRYSIKNWNSEYDAFAELLHIISDFLDIFVYILELKLVNLIAGGYINKYENRVYENGIEIHPPAV
jgi:hypothetical protein